MKTVIGLFDDQAEAKRAYTALVQEGYAKADLDILTNDDKDDEPKLATCASGFRNRISISTSKVLRKAELSLPPM